LVVRKERERLERMLKYIVASLDLDSPKASYIGVFLLKEHSVTWIAHIKQLAALAAQVNLTYTFANHRDIYNWRGYLLCRYLYISCCSPMGFN
jgi:hypothetical protein